MTEAALKTFLHLAVVMTLFLAQLIFPRVFAYEPWIAVIVMPSLLTWASEPSVSVFRGGACTLLAGWWYDSLSGLPLSVYTLTFVVIYASIRLLVNRISLRPRYALFLGAFFSTLLGLLFVELLRLIYDPNRSETELMIALLLKQRAASALVTACLCSLLVPVLLRVEEGFDYRLGGLRA